MKRWRAVWLILIGILLLVLSIRARRMEADAGEASQRQPALASSPDHSSAGTTEKWLGLFAVAFGCGLLFRDLSKPPSDDAA